MINSPIQTALCSFGMSGKVFHAPFLFVHQGYNLYAVWERSTKAVNDLYPGTKSYSRFEDLLADETIELVVVNTPNATHYDYAKQALLIGKHVVIEKPFVETVEQGEDLIALAKKQRKLISVYQNRRFDSDYRTVKNVLNQNLLGNIAEVEIKYDRYKEEISPKHHKETPGPAVGVVYDLGSHLIDQALQLFGMPQAVFADITTIRPVSKVDDYFEIIMYYPCKRVRLKSTYVAREPVPSYVLHGSKGTFIKGRTDVQEIDLQAGKLPQGHDWGTEPESEKGWLHTEINGEVINKRIESQKGDYMDFYEELYKAIRKGSRLPVTAEEGLNVIRIIEAAYKSSTERRVVEL